MSLLALTWRDVWFLHWPVAPDAVAERLPEGLSVDTYNGRAYLGVVALEITDAGLGVPGVSDPVGTGEGFAELNLRTYVRHDGAPGVYFFSLDAADPVAVEAARAAYGLPYYRAEARLRETGDGRSLSLRRTHRDAPGARFVGTCRPEGERSRTPTGSLAAFLVERYRFYLHRAGRLWAGEIDHVPWRPSPAVAEVRSNTLPPAIGVEVEGEPHALYAAHDGMAVEAGPVRPV